MEQGQASGLDERVLVLVKAVPNPSIHHGETVCCAGITLEHQWRRLFPIRFRHLNQETRFRRWQWLEYRWRKPTSDQRSESRHVFEDSLRAGDEMPVGERSDFLASIIAESADAAARLGQSLTIVRPVESKFYWQEKSSAEIERERAGYESAGRQTSFLDNELACLEPCPLDFRMKFRDSSGWHDHACFDWETTATYWKLGRRNSTRALSHLSKMYNEEYPKRGMVLALGTMAKRQNQWLLLGVIRLDRATQMGFDV